jgi:hypothetical protein
MGFLNETCAEMNSKIGNESEDSGVDDW